MNEVSHEAVVVWFVKYLGEPKSSYRVPSEVDASFRSRTRLACFHHYDEVHLNTLDGNVQDVSNVFAAQCPEQTASSKTVICYQLLGERSPGFSFEKLGRVVELVLLRISHEVGVPTIDIEGAIPGIVKRLVPDGVEWGLAHTLAKRETMLVLAHNTSLSSVEVVAYGLRNLLLCRGSSRQAFDLVANWPCVKMEENETAYSLSLDGIADEALPDAYGVRVIGFCQKDKDHEYECTKELNTRVSVTFEQPNGTTVVDPAGASGKAGSQRKPRAIAGSHMDRDVATPRDVKKARDILQTIHGLRNHCKSSSCSIDLLRRKDAAQQGDSYYLSEAPIRMRNPTPVPKEACTPLKKIKGTPGSRLIGEHIETLRNEILEGLSNPLTLSEFEDLAAYLDRFGLISANYRYVEQSPDPSREKQFENWVNCQGFAKRLIAFLQRAVDERVRQDICGESDHIQSASLGASGFSRIGGVGTYICRKVLAQFGLDWSGICINGVFPDYRVDEILELVNSKVEATLEPFWHFGLCHEIGHMIWVYIVLGAGTFHEVGLRKRSPMFDEKEFDEMVPPGRKEFAEYFSDAFCLQFAFDRDIQRYVGEWVRYYIDWIENDNAKDFLLSLAEPGSAETDAGLSATRVFDLSAASYCHRLLMAAAFSTIDHDGDIKEEDVVSVAMSRLQTAALPIIRQKPGFGYVAASFDKILQLFSRIVDYQNRGYNGPVDREEHVIWKAMMDIPSAARNVKRILDHLTAKTEMSYSPSQLEAAVADLRTGRIHLSPVSWPCAVLHPLGSNADYRTCIAALVSLTHWSEIDEAPGAFPAKAG